MIKDSHGGTVLAGGTINKQKRFIAPTIIESPRKNSLMMEGEILGPILPIFPFNNLTDVIHEIN